MDYYSSQISKLIEELSRLPGIGPKSAQRLAFHLIHMPKEQVKELADSMVDARENAAAVTHLRIRNSARSVATASVIIRPLW